MNRMNRVQHMSKLPGRRDILQWSMEKSRVAFEFGQLKGRPSPIDHGFEQPRDDIVGMGEIDAVNTHKSGVTANIRDEKERPLNGHARDNTRIVTLFKQMLFDLAFWFRPGKSGWHFSRLSTYSKKMSADDRRPRRRR